MLRRSCVFVLFSVCIVISNGQLTIPGLSVDLGGLANLGNALQGALGGGGTNPLAALTGGSNPLSALSGLNPLSGLGNNPLGDLGNAAQNLGNMMGNATGGLQDALQSALNNTRDILTTLLQFKLALYQAKYNGTDSNFNFPNMNTETPTTTPSSSRGNSPNPNSGLGSVLSNAANTLGGALSGGRNPLSSATNALGGLMG